MHACLRIEIGQGTPVTCTLTPERSITLGRFRDNTIIIQDRHASRHHAEVVFREGRWHLRDRGTLNGTRHNGERLHRAMPLEHNDVIAIGDTRLRFMVGASFPPLPDPLPHTTDLDIAAVPPSSGHTVFLMDELTALCRFMQEALKEEAPRHAITRALGTIRDQTGATATGYLSFDRDDPLPRVVLPDLAQVDIHLSRKLTDRLLTNKRVIWLAGEGNEAPESVLSFKDAICLPILGADGSLEAAVHVYLSGRNFSDRQVRFCEAVIGYLSNCLQLLRARRHLQAENLRLREHHRSKEDELIGDSAALKKLRQVIALVAPGPGNVLIHGESGSGKELVALALHRLSLRHNGPLVTVNCAAIPGSLLEAELFGHRKGTFTGATENREGLFEQADEGTLFLDEIGELSPECQAKLLRAMDGKGIRPVGATEDIQVDVRILAATNRALDQEVAAGRFREDLFYRLRIPIRVPPLREHATDIPALAAHFLRTLSAEYRRQAQLTEAALQRLLDYSWPGNVRQLRSVLETALAMSATGKIDVEDLPLGPAVARSGEGLPTLNIEELEAEAIRQALRQTDGNKAQAARVLGVHRDTLLLKMKKYKIEKE